MTTTTTPAVAAAVAVAAETTRPAPGHDVDIAATLACYRHGHGDPTTTLTTSGHGIAASGEFLHATITPEGPATIRLRWHGQRVSIEGHGPGGAWLADRAPAMLGRHDGGLGDTDTAGWDPVVVTALHRHRHVRFGAGGNLYHELLATVIEQRITSQEAHRQWRLLCRRLGEPAPGAFAGLLLPPAPIALRRHPSWWFHPLGIERSRAETLIEVARHASKLWAWAGLPPHDVADRLGLLRGVGQWTIGTVLASACGDPDAVAVGDFHLKNMVGFALAGQARATDERMMELLEPYRGQRGRVVRALRLDGRAAPKFGPRQRIIAMNTW